MTGVAGYAQRHLEHNDYYNEQRRLRASAGGILINGGFMNREDIVVEIDAEITRLQQAKALLTGTTAIDGRNPARPSGARNTRRWTMSAEAREKIAAAQRARWAKSKRAAKKAAREITAEPATRQAGTGKPVKRTLSAGARAKIAAAQRARWAKTRRGKKATSAKSARTSPRAPKAVPAKKAGASKTSAPAPPAAAATPASTSS
jgi:hypothetical protein